MYSGSHKNVGAQHCVIASNCIEKSNLFPFEPALVNEVVETLTKVCNFISKIRFRRR